MKKIRDLCAFILLLGALSFSAFAEEWVDTVEAYAPVLAQYAAAFTGAEDALMARESAEDAYWYAFFAQRDPGDIIGYSYLDLNRDGMPELVIGTVCDEAGMEDQLIFEVLTIKDDTPVTVIRGWERFRIQLTAGENGAPDAIGYYAEGSSGASNSIYEHGLVGVDMTQWEDAHTLEVNYDESNRAYWTLDEEQITETQAMNILEAWRKSVMRVSLLSFSTYENERVLGNVDTADDSYHFSASVSGDGPALNVLVWDTGKRNLSEAIRENILSVTVAYLSGGVIRQFE